MSQYFQCLTLIPTAEVNFFPLPSCKPRVQHRYNNEEAQHKFIRDTRLCWSHGKGRFETSRPHNECLVAQPQRLQAGCAYNPVSIFSSWGRRDNQYKSKMSSSAFPYPLYSFDIKMKRSALHLIYCTLLCVFITSTKAAPPLQLPSSGQFRLLNISDSHSALPNLTVSHLLNASSE